MKKVLTIVLCAGVMFSSFATMSRVLSMGKHDAFFMDDQSIFRNPANVNVYPNMLLGSYGEYQVVYEDTAGEYAALERKNRDPRDPFFGAILTHALKKSPEETQYPMLSIGAVFGRKDKHILNSLYIPRGIEIINGDTITYLDPIGNIDAMIGYSLAGGGMLGLGYYTAFQRETEGRDNLYKSSIQKVSLGVNWPVARSVNFEASVGISARNVIGRGVRDDDGFEEIFVHNRSLNDITVEADIRLFSAMTALNGDLVPHAGFEFSQLGGADNTFLGLAGGMGLNVNIDKGFFWAALEGLYERLDLTSAELEQRIGGRVSFGIERNVVWDWFVVRVGGKKRIMAERIGKYDTRVIQNPEHDSNDDMVGLGIGLNVENRLRFDILVAEDIQNTLTNLFSGPQHHVFTRIDATFSF